MEECKVRRAKSEERSHAFLSYFVLRTSLFALRILFVRKVVLRIGRIVCIPPRVSQTRMISRAETIDMRPWMLLPLMFAGCQSLENRLVFHPERHAAPPARSLPAPLEDVTLRTADGTKIHARWCPHPNAKGAILYCHGNAGNLEDYGQLMREFWQALDRSVLIIDYPGYGRSEGKPSEAGCYAAAAAAYDWLTHDAKVPAERIVIAGESLGGGVAVDLATKQPHQALVLIRTFTSIPNVVKDLYWMPLAPAVMKVRFESEKKLPSCPAPIFIAQADNDRIIPFAHGERLRGVSKTPTHFHRLPGLDHNDPLPASFFREVRAFLDRLDGERAE